MQNVDIKICCRCDTSKWCPLQHFTIHMYLNKSKWQIQTSLNCQYVNNINILLVAFHVVLFLESRSHFSLTMRGKLLNDRRTYTYNKHMIIVRIFTIRSHENSHTMVNVDSKTKEQCGVIWHYNTSSSRVDIISNIRILLHNTISTLRILYFTILHIKYSL